MKQQLVELFVIGWLGLSLAQQEGDAANAKMTDPGRHVATDNQMVIRQENGDVIMGTDSGHQFKAELRMANNEVKGVYSYLQPNGSPYTVAYTAGVNGYRTMPLAQLGLALPPFPYSLYGAPNLARGGFTQLPEARVPDLVYPKLYGESDDDEDDGSDDYDDNDEEGQGDGGSEVVESEDQPTPPENDLAPGIPINQGTPVAASRPSAVAVAGAGSTAQASPVSQAFVGPGGVAIAFPTAQASVGPGGVAISRPVAVSNAGHGGVAVAGGISTAFAGIQQPQEGTVVKEDDDIIDAVISRTPQWNFALPIVANYYFAAPTMANAGFPYTGFYPVAANKKQPETQARVKPTPTRYNAYPTNYEQPPPAIRSPYFYNAVFARNQPAAEEATSRQLNEYSAPSYEEFKKQF